MGNKRTAVLKKKFLTTLILLCLVCVPNAVSAQSDHAERLKIGVYESPPFVIRAADGSFQGMAVELWQTATKDLNIASEYIQYHNFRNLTAAAVRGEIDVILTNFTVTHERTQVLSISYPWFDAGMRVMINNEHKSDVFEELVDSGHIYPYIWLAVLLAALTLLITLARRRFDKNFHKEWKLGLAASFHDLILAAKSGRISYAFLGWLGYVLSGLWMIVGVALIAYVTSTLTTAMTTVSLSFSIKSLQDLPGKDVGVLAGSVGYDFLLSMGMDVYSYDELDEAVNDLHQKKLDAIVADAPVLEYWAYARPELNLDVVGNLFYPEKYAFAANKAHDGLMDAVSLEVIRLHELGELKAMKEKYFGPEDF